MDITLALQSRAIAARRCYQTVLLTRVRQVSSSAFPPSRYIFCLGSRVWQRFPRHGQIFYLGFFNSTSVKHQAERKRRQEVDSQPFRVGLRGSPARVVLAPLLEDVASQLPSGGPVDSDIPHPLFAVHDLYCLIRRGFHFEQRTLRLLLNHDDGPYAHSKTGQLLKTVQPQLHDAHTLLVYLPL